MNIYQAEMVLIFSKGIYYEKFDELFCTYILFANVNI